MSKSTPNLYSFATKELAQDATLAYILAWADPSHQDSNPELHRLGSALLKSLLASYRDTKVSEVSSVNVTTQVDRIDLLAHINSAKENGLLLLIEDKVGAHLHSKQLERYIAKIERKHEGSTIVPVFVKTGNTSQHLLPSRDEAGRFLRRNLLDVLGQFPHTGDTIVDNFREHLEACERDTQAYLDKTPSNWKAPQIEGFYGDIETRLQPDYYIEWGHASNPAGGIQWFTFGGDRFSRNGLGYSVYPQIVDGLHLTVRLSAKSGQRIGKDVMGAALEELQTRVSPPRKLTVSRPRRSRSGGNTAAFAVIGFEEDGGFLALTADGHVDPEATEQRLRQVAEVLPKVADALSTEE